MNWLVFHIVSGHAFFTGILLVIVGVLASTAKWPVCRRMSGTAFVVGAMGIAVSSTPIANWLYAVSIVVTLAWIWSRFKPTWSPWAAYATLLAWLIAALTEVPYHLTPTIQLTDERQLTVIGDSITAGVGGDERSETWPSILAGQHQLQVQDVSHMGETAASALKRISSQTITSQVVLVEIGGNDLFGQATSSQFAADLDALLSTVASQQRQVIMFELPLPPFCHEYGRLQRVIAAKHGVKLIPKRVLLSVLAAEGSTLDSIHLSPSGHQRMADTIWRLVSPHFRSAEN